MIFRRKVDVNFKRRKLTRGEAADLARLNDYDLVNTRAALAQIVENTIIDILNSHLMEGALEVKDVVWKVNQILSAIDRADKYKNKKENS